MAYAAGGLCLSVRPARVDAGPAIGAANMPGLPVQKSIFFTQYKKCVQKIPLGGFLYTLKKSLRVFCTH